MDIHSGAAGMLVDPSVVCPVLIGRDAPLSVALQTLGRAREGRGSTLCVSGEAGIGKSRLVRAVLDQARGLGFVVLQGACFEADRAHPYAPVVDLVRVLSATTSPALAAHYFAPAAVELATLFPELRPIVGDVARDGVRTPEEDRRRLFHALTESVQALGNVQPLLVVIEDVHWSDDATLELLLHLARRIGAHPIALVLTFRSDEVGPRLAHALADLDRARCGTEVVLRPLGGTEVAAMLHAIFGASPALGSAFVDGLHVLTEGNPFFVEEMLKALLVAGDLARVDGAWQVGALGRVRVPRTATDAVVRRLTGLSPEAREVASVAAVAGRRFDFDLLQALTRHDERELLPLVRELIDAQLVVEESADRFAFRHALTREAIRARLLARERVALHRAIASALEARSDLHEADDVLAYHCFEAGAWEPARRHALRAAEHALTLCAPREALHQLDRAVAATEHAGERPDAALLVARGRAHETLGAFREADDDFTAALDAARACADQRGEWEALYASGMLWAARDYERAAQDRWAALDVARAIGDPTLVARSLNRVGNWLVNREDPAAGIPYHDEALAIQERVGDRRGVAETVDLLAVAHHMAGMQTRAVALYERSVELLTEMEDRRGLVTALAVVAVCGPSYHASPGPVCTSVHTAAVLDDERAVRLAVDIGWRAGEAFSRYLLADALGWRGEYRRALGLAREALVIAEELEHRQWQCGARRTLGRLALDLCAPDEASLQLEAAHDIACRLGSTTWIRWTAAPLAIAWARTGRHDAASRLLDPLAGVTTPLHGTLAERWLALARAETALAAGDAAGALAVVGTWDATQVPAVALVQARALVALERWEDATVALGRARDGAQGQQARGLLWQVLAVEGAAHLGARRRRDARRAFDLARETALSLVVELDEPLFVAAFRAGVDRAAPPPPAPTAGQAAKAASGGLTRRERETAALVARGQSNRAIARALGIGERTVETHVAAALSKLAFSTRAQLAVWAAEQGLVVD